MEIISFLRSLATVHPWRTGRRRLLDSLYDLARLEEKGSLHVRPRRFDLARRVENVVSVVAREEGERIVIAIPHDLHVTVDPDAFDRIVANLVSNAVQYGKPPFSISTELAGDQVRVMFSDGGRGISPEFEPRLFERFARSEISRTRSEGAGLGLALSRLYARANGGDLIYEPTLAPGAQFCLILPTVSTEASRVPRRVDLGLHESRSSGVFIRAVDGLRSL